MNNIDDEEFEVINTLEKLSSTHRMILSSLMSYCLLPEKEKVVKVFLGGQKGVQVEPLKAAWRQLNNFKEGWSLQCISVNIINELHWSPSDFVDWLLDSHIHIIASHVHQGVSKVLNWDMEDLEIQLQRLKFHLGFPNLLKLKCPVFLQDKYRYLNNLPNSKVNNTLQLYLTDDVTYYNVNNENVMSRIKRF